MRFFGKRFDFIQNVFILHYKTNVDVLTVLLNCFLEKETTAYFFY